MANLFEGLNNIPIFEGVPDEDRRRALLETGLGLMQPFNPLTGSVATQFTGGVQAGLTSLDTTEAKNTATEQQAFENIIKGRGATAEEVRANAAKTTSESTTTVAETGAGRLKEEHSQFDREKALRDAKVLLDSETAAWMKRRWTGPPGATSKVTTATTNAEVIERWENVLFDADPKKYTRPDGTRNDDMLTVDAFGAMHKQSAVAGTENLASILQSGEAGDISKNISGLQGVAPGPGSVSVAPEGVTASPQTQADIEALPPGTRFTWIDGKEYTKD